MDVIEFFILLFLFGCLALVVAVCYCLHQIKGLKRRLTAAERRLQDQATASTMRTSGLPVETPPQPQPMSAEPSAAKQSPEVVSKPERAEQYPPLKAPPPIPEKPLPGQASERAAPIQEKGKEDIPPRSALTGEPARAPVQTAAEAGIQGTGTDEPAGGPPGFGEAEFGSYWATRVGIVLAVLGTVFFGIWVNQHAEPWVRWVELLLASFGLAAFGFFFERKYENYGRVVQAGGFALLYFTAFAGYAVPPARIIPVEYPLVGLVLQLAVVLLITAYSVWRRSELMAAMGVFLAILASVFSMQKALTAYGIGTAGFLALLGGVLYVRKFWRKPYFIAIGGCYALFLFYQNLSDGSQWSQPIELLWPPLLFMLIFLMADGLGRLHGHRLDIDIRRLAVLTNTSLAIALGLLATNTHFPLDGDHGSAVSTFCLVFGLIILAAWQYFQWTRDDIVIRDALFAKGLGLLALYVVTKFGGPVEYLAMFVQAVAVLTVARRDPTLLRQLTFNGLCIAASLNFAYQMYELKSAMAPGEASGFLWSSDGLAGTVFVLGTAVLAGFYPRVFRHRDLEEENVENTLFGVIGQLVGVLALVLVSVTTLVPALNALLALGVAMFGVAMFTRHYTPALSGVLCVLVAFGMFFYEFDVFDPLLRQGAVLLAYAAAGIVAASMLLRGHPRWRDWALGALHVLWIMAYGHILAEHTVLLDHTGSFLLAMILPTVAIQTLPTLRRQPVLGDLSLFPLALAAFAVISRQMPLVFGYQSRLQSTLLALSGLALAALAIAFIRGWLAERPEQRLSAKVVETIQILAGGLLLLVAVSHNNAYVHWESQDAAFAVGIPATQLFAIGAIGWAGLSLWLSNRPCALVGHFFAAAAFLRLIGEVNTELRLLEQQDSLAEIAAACFVLSLVPLLINFRKWGRETVHAAGLTYGTLIAFILFVAFVRDRFGFDAYATAFAAAMGILFFGAGLVFRFRAYRMVGLTTLGACVVRLIFVDLDGEGENWQLYRIIAFIVVGLVLLVIGFLYNKYRDFIAEWDEDAPAKPTSADS